MPDTPAVVAQLRVLEQLTRTESRIARLRVAQARTDDTRRELTDNARESERRLARIQQALRELHTLPDAVGTLGGRLLALVTSQIEQAQRFDESLLGDLALERQLQDRAHYLQALTADGPERVHRLAGDLADAHADTVEWLTTVLAESAVGGPAPLRATPFQVLRGGITRVAWLPARLTTVSLNLAVQGIGDAGRTLRRLGGGVGTATEAAGDVFGSGLDAALDRAEQVTRGSDGDTLARTVHITRRARGALHEEELPIDDFDDLSVRDAAEAIRKLDDPLDVQAVLRYEERHKNRSGVVTVARSRHAEVARETIT